MSSPSAYQCLFCNHLNPAGASFCNECGSQLQLQQCDLCGSINKRSARVCYKCGAAFTFASPLGANAALFEQHTPTVAFDRTAIEDVQTTLPESVVEALGVQRAKLQEVGTRGNSPKAYADTRPGAGNAETVDDHSSTASPAGAGLSSAVVATGASGFKFRDPLALVALVSLLGLALLLYTRTPSAPQVPLVQGGVTQSGGDPRQLRAQSSLASGAVDAVGESAPVSSAAARIDGGEAGEVGGIAATQREPAARTCLPAVAALGLCNAASTQEKR